MTAAALLRAAAKRRHAARRAAFNLVFGSRLRLVRMALGISEQEAATIFRRTLRTYRKIEAGHASPSYGMVALSDRYNIWGIWGWLGGGDMPPDCEGLSPTAAIRKMAGHAAH